MKLKLRKKNKIYKNMNSKIEAILKTKHFFSLISFTNNSAKYTLEKPAQILMKNIHINWLRYVLVKTQKSMQVFNQKPLTDAKPPFGIIHNSNIEYKSAILEHNLNDLAPDTKTNLNFSIILPRDDQIMQYFVQWLRYRKYWWSSITTTPSLFATDDIKQKETGASVDIIARLSPKSQPVEHIKLKINDEDWVVKYPVHIEGLSMRPYVTGWKPIAAARILKNETEMFSFTTGNAHIIFLVERSGGNSSNSYGKCSCLSCTMSLESALMMLLYDSSNNSDGNYLRLHRKVAPYKISFALHFQESSNEVTLKELASLLYNRLKLEKISAWLPDFSMDTDAQVKENLRMGVTYTAILSEGTLKTGIFYLLNSSTMLKEQIHVADFHTYAALICSAK